MFPKEKTPPPVLSAFLSLIDGKNGLPISTTRIKGFV
jgi:hypothetical protein